jgi:hypothetical protein
VALGASADLGCADRRILAAVHGAKGPHGIVSAAVLQTAFDAQGLRSERGQERAVEHPAHRPPREGRELLGIRRGCHRRMVPTRLGFP